MPSHPITPDPSADPSRAASTDPATGGGGNRAAVSPRKLYRTVATAEMVTWALLLGGMFCKYVLGLGDLPLRVGGSVHGFVFLAYCVSTVLVWTDQRWPLYKGVLGLVLSVVPFATVPFERHVDRQGLLPSRWRVAAAGTATSHGTGAERGQANSKGQEPARTWAERLLAVILRWPIVSGLVLVVLVSLLFSVLLQAGPPTEWFN